MGAFKHVHAAAAHTSQGSQASVLLSLATLLALLLAALSAGAAVVSGPRDGQGTLGAK